MTQSVENKPRGFHLPSFLAGAATTFLIVGVALFLNPCRPEPVPVGGQTTDAPVGAP